MSKKKHWKGLLYWTYKVYCWLKGKKIEKKLIEGVYYTSSHFPYSRFLYHGNGLFYRAIQHQVGSVSCFKQIEYKPKIWEIGFFNFKPEYYYTRNLTIDDILVVYDIPQVLLATDIGGTKYICILTDVDKKGNLEFLCVVISITRLQMLNEGLVDLRSIFVNPEDKKLIYKGTWNNLNDKSMTVFEFNYKKISEGMLPKGGFYFDGEIGKK